MNINTVFSSYIKADDLQGRRIQVLIGEVRTEEVGKDLKPILYFQGKTKGMVLNRTNANVIAEAYGNETDGWFGRPIILYVAMVDFQGKRVPGLRVEVPRQQGFDQRAQAPAHGPQNGGAQQRPHDEWGTQAQAPAHRQPESAGGPPPSSYSPDLSDEVPF